MENDKVLYEQALLNTTRILKSYGNEISNEQYEALSSLIKEFTWIAVTKQKQPVRRTVFPMPCGTGKTTAIRGFCQAINELGRPYNIVICAEKIEALCQLNRDLINDGVPSKKISLIHSKKFDPNLDVEDLDKNYASEPNTDKNDLQQFVLMSHAKLNSINKFGYDFRFGHDLLIYDESLILGEPYLQKLSDITKSLAGYSGVVDGERYGEYSKEKLFSLWCNEIKEHLVRQDEGVIPSVKLPISYDEAKKIISNIFNNQDPLLKFLDLHEQGTDMRVLKSEQGMSIVSYKKTIPEYLSDIIILDASYPIRKLLSYDSTVKSKRLHQVKSYENVKVYTKSIASGRYHIMSELSNKRKPKIFIETVNLTIKLAKKKEKVLIFTHKDALDYLKSMLKKVASKNEYNRVSFLSWGNETAINKYSDCTAVILAGVIQLPQSCLAGMMIAQADNINLEWNEDDLMKINQGEKVHRIYQALNRGQCRKVKNGKALPMKTYIFTYDVDGLKYFLKKIMHDASFIDYKAELLDNMITKKEQCSREIISLIRSREESGEIKTSTANIFKNIGQNYKPDTKECALNHALNTELPTWKRENRSIVRTLS
ncbi:DEAD/DEAH box helicase family protein [Magnetovibrio blakemorei]|uniref:Helicase/UvrB N-terminal domain-containing protein n=1 Tax=Magnetovibrio blakemorei TaxID=28181 RepID=A0A1E5Q5K4_9PROT|nr:DEAD/DEAH box helicase family protein [Magnetovibrio blakemorei]OEJ65649.1 hypothetical protein BEN30_13910 [Magnetovibrio blakemorei]